MLVSAAQAADYRMRRSLTEQVADSCCAAVVGHFQLQLSVPEYLGSCRKHLQRTMTMKTLIALSAAASMAMVTSLAQARDIGLDEALQLQSAGKIKPVAELTAAALSQHAGGKAEYTELEEELGRLIYQVEVRDAQGVKWDVDVDAVSGQILKNKRDD
jgi:uncharacterized membrane protein YkoI